MKMREPYYFFVGERQFIAHQKVKYNFAINKQRFVAGITEAMSTIRLKRRKDFLRSSRV